MNRKMRCPSGGIYSYENLVCKRERDDLTGLECAENIGKGVVSRPETCFSGQPTKWAKDIYKKGHGPVPEVE